MKNLGYSNEAMIWKHPGCLESVEADFREDSSVVVVDATAVRILQIRESLAHFRFRCSSSGICGEKREVLKIRIFGSRQTRFKVIRR